jgi:hypothetical protein
MDKTDLKMFKMSKAQMNNVVGGTIYCFIYNRETGQSHTLQPAVNIEEMTPNEVANQLALEYGPGYNITCWNE